MSIFIVIVLVVLVFGIGFYNQLVTFKNLMGEAWSGIDAQLKRRYDLIPNVVETVKGYQQYEKNTLERIIALRSGHPLEAGPEGRAAFENQVSGALKTIFAVAEAYPDLKANEEFLMLQKTLIQIEDELQMARRYYNGTVRNFNVGAQSFPGNVIAGIFHFTPAVYFEIEYATERQTPDVKFD